MSQIKNSCQLDSVHRYQHLSLSLRLSLSTQQDVWERERERRDKGVPNSPGERHLELESSLW